MFMQNFLIPTYWTLWDTTLKIWMALYNRNLHIGDCGTLWFGLMVCYCHGSKQGSQFITSDWWSWLHTKYNISLDWLSVSFFYCWLEMLHSFLSVKILHRIAVKLQWQLQTFLHAQLMHLCQLVIHVHLQDAGSKCLLIGQEGKVAILPMRQRKGWCKLWNVFLFCKLSKPSAVDCFHAATGCCIEEQCFEWSSGAG